MVGGINNFDSVGAAEPRLTHEMLGTQLENLLRPVFPPTHNI